MDIVTSGGRSLLEVPATFWFNHADSLPDGTWKLYGEVSFEFDRPSLERRPVEVVVKQDGDSYRALSVTINPDSPPTSERYGLSVDQTPLVE